MRAAVYARLSRPKDKQELGANIEDQQVIGEQLISRHDDWQHVGTFTDNGRGAYKDDAKRPAWEQVLTSKPDIIVVRDAERLGRHPREYVALLDSKAKIIEWLDEETADVKWDAPVQNPDSDEFAQKTVGARSYSRKIGSKVKRKIRTKAAGGAWPHGGTRAFGYHDHCCRDGAGNVTCLQGAIRDDEAPIILEVAERWLAGESLMALCRDLDSQGVTTPAGKPWQYARLRAMLSGPRIAGIRTHNGVEMKGQWEPIVSPDLHRRLVTAASASVKRVGENASYDLSGLVMCGICGARMYGLKQTIKGVKRSRYVCRAKGCGLGIAVAQTDLMVWSHAFMSILYPELRNQEQAKGDLAALTEKQGELDRRIAELDTAYWNDQTINKERWLSISGDLSTTLDAVKSQIKDLRRSLAQDRDLPTTAEDLAERMREADPRERNRLLKVGVGKVVISRATRTGRFDPDRVAIYLRTASDLQPKG
jgi:site-specific DNA recombinase